MQKKSLQTLVQQTYERRVQLDYARYGVLHQMREIAVNGGLHRFRLQVDRDGKDVNSANVLNVVPSHFLRFTCEDIFFHNAAFCF